MYSHDLSVSTIELHDPGEEDESQIDEEEYKGSEKILIAKNSAF